MFEVAWHAFIPIVLTVISIITYFCTLDKDSDAHSSMFVSIFLVAFQLIHFFFFVIFILLIWLAYFSTLYFIGGA
jgi:hypothetical protein